MQSFLWVELKSFQFLHVWFQWEIYCGGMSPTCWISWSESGRNESDRWHVPGTAQSWRTDRCRWRSLESCMKCWYLFESPPICYACESSLYTHVYTMFGVLCCLSWWFLLCILYMCICIYIYISFLSVILSRIEWCIDHLLCKDVCFSTWHLMKKDLIAHILESCNSAEKYKGHDLWIECVQFLRAYIRIFCMYIYIIIYIYMYYYYTLYIFNVY